MIAGNKKRKGARFLPDFRAGLFAGWVEPNEGTRLVGIPWGWYAEGSPPFIEVHDIEGHVIETVNALACCAIQFDSEEGEDETP